MSVKDANSGTVKTYYYEKNLQGDIIGIMNEAGYKVVSYTYDAWGNPYNPTYVYHSGVSAIDRANTELNPFRYRGYYYDSETGYYYLQTRYYNPEWGRFLNADSALYNTMLGFNLFAYCDNNPVNCVDPYGESGVGAALAGWASSAWLLTLVDGPLPVGDAVYIGGIVVLGIIVIAEAAILAENVAEVTGSEKKSSSDGKSIPEPPDVEYPGDDPTVAPGDDYEWVGKDKQGGKRGGYKNKNGKDSWHPDLDHPDGIEPHWDYNDGRGGKWRIFPNGIEKK